MKTISHGKNHLADHLLNTDSAIYLIADFNQLYRSADDGQSWAQANFPAGPDCKINFMWQSGNKVVAFGEGGVYTSTDNGRFYVSGYSNGGLFIGMSDDLVNWKKWTVDNSGQGRSCYDVLAHDNLLIAPFSNSGICFSKDCGATWALMPGSDEPQLGLIYAMARDTDFIYAGSAFYGVWRYPLAGLLDATEAPGSSSVHSALLFPNPVRQHTNLSYTLERPARVRISLYDPAGKFVAALAGGYRNSGPVQEQLEFPTGLAPGQYYVVISSGQGQTFAPAIVR